MQEERLIPAQIYSALNRPNLLFGGERELMLLSGLMSVTLIFLAMKVATIIIGTILWLFLSTVLRMMAKSDPMMSKIYMRQLHHQKFYLSHSTPFQGVKQ